jgi:hypothetical protein
MQYSVLLLTASLISAAPGDVPADAKAPAAAAAAANAQAPAAAPAAPAVQTTTTVMPADAAPAKPTIGQRLRNFFMPQHAERPETPPLEPRDVHVAAPTSSTPAATSGLRATLGAPVTSITAMRPSYEQVDKDAKQVGHEQDYSWITGKLARAPGANSRWVLRYTAPYEQDRYNGEVLLTGGQELSPLHEGDLICVHGKVVTGLRSSGNTTYQVNSVDMIEKAAH